MGMLLIHLDGKSVPKKLFGGALAVGILSPLVWRFLYPVPAFSQLAPESLVAPLATSAAGLVFGILFWICNLFIWSMLKRRQSFSQYGNPPLMEAVAGLFLGWQALVGILLFNFYLGAFWRLGRIWGKKSPAPIDDLILLVATFLVLITWRPLAELFPR